MLSRMRAWIAFIASLLAFAFAASGGCSSDVSNDDNPAVTTVTVAGAGGGLGFGCFGGSPDRFCNVFGDVPETCGCPDCAQSAHCKGVCKDDGSCDQRPDADDG